MAEEELTKEEIEKLTESEITEITAKTQIIMSFGSANGGIDIAKKIWRDNRTRYEKDPFLLFSVDEGFIYLDAETLKGKKGTYIKDRKPLNDSWKKIYQKAMKKASIMLFIITKEWLASRWCEKEFDWYRKEKTEHMGKLDIAFLIETNALDLLTNSRKLNYFDPDTGESKERNCGDFWQEIITRGKTTEGYIEFNAGSSLEDISSMATTLISGSVGSSGKK